MGVQVEFPLEQTCCGQMHANSGYGHEAIGLVRRFVRVFGAAEAAVTPSGSCAAEARGGQSGKGTAARVPARGAHGPDPSPPAFGLSEFLVRGPGAVDPAGPPPPR